jgi:hypothetical protein
MPFSDLLILANSFFSANILSQSENVVSISNDFNFNTLDQLLGKRLESDSNSLENTQTTTN